MAFHNQAKRVWFFPTNEAISPRLIMWNSSVFGARGYTEHVYLVDKYIVMFNASDTRNQHLAKHEVLKYVTGEAVIAVIDKDGKSLGCPDNLPSKLDKVCRKEAWLRRSAEIQFLARGKTDVTG